MKGGNLNIFRGRKLSFSLVALICLTLVVWAWENTPLLASFLPSTDRFTMHSPEMLMGTPVSQSLYKHQQPSVEKDSLDVTTQGAPSIDDSNEVFAAMPMGSAIPSSSGNITGKKDLIQMPSGKRDCNFAKGKWIIDNKRPLYSGFGCKQWLSKMWACRLMQRTDFYYERVRWQPYNCEMPDFDGSTFLRKMQHKTIAFIGDSLGRQQFQSLMCMATGGEDSPEVENVGREYGLVKARGAIRPDGWAYRVPSTNTTILYYWSASLCELEPLNRSDPTTRYAMHLDRPATFLSQYLHMFDVLVLNTGHHWNRGKLTGNRWDMYVGGVPNIDQKLADINNAKNLTVYSIAKWVDSQLPKHPHLRAFFRTISPRHFVNGDWNTGGSCDSTIPLAGGSEVLQDGSTDTVVEGAVKATRVKILDITAISQLRDEGHISKYANKDSDGIHDCLHWCLPGIPDTWNEILFAQLYEDVRS